MHKFFALSLAASALAMTAPAAQAATTINTSTGSNPRSFQVFLNPALGTGLDVAVAGGADGALTFTDPAGVSFGPTGVPAICSVVSATAARCGTAAEPVTYLYISGSGLSDAVDLTGLAAQTRSAGPFAEATNAFDTDRRMRGVFVHVMTAGGADVINGGAVGASFEPGEGADTVLGGSADEIFRAAATADGDDAFDGGAGYDTMSYSPRTAGVTASIADAPTTGNGETGGGESDTLSGVEALSGSSGADKFSITGIVGGLGTLIGNGGDDALTGGPGTDKLSGGAGADELRGEGGDDRLQDSRLMGEAQGHLHGGAGDDELIQRDTQWSAAPRLPDGAPTCGEGTDILRADRGSDDGVTNLAGPVDCEFLDNAAADATLTGDLRVGGTVALQLPAGVPGAPFAGRIAKVDWAFCAADGSPLDCYGRTTTGPELVIEAADAGRRITSATLHLSESLSQAPRWLEERATLPQVLSTFIAAVNQVVPAGDRPSAVPPVSGPAPIAKFVPAVKPDVAALSKSLTAAFGKKPKLALLKKARTLRFSAAAGSAIAVSLTTKKGKKTTKLAAGNAVAGADGKVALKLTPTAAGRKASKGTKALTVRVVLSARNTGGESATTAKLTLKTR